MTDVENVTETEFTTQEEATPDTTGGQARYICWTWNNPPGADNPSARDLLAQQALGALSRMPSCTYVIFQLEQGENGTYHYQGYSEFRRPTRYSAFASAVGIQIHCENRRGTQDQAIDYCRKVDTSISGPYVHGVPSTQRPGKRNDLIDFRDAIRSNKRRRELVEEFPKQCALYPRFIRFVRSAFQSDGFKHRRVVLLIGDPGVGKTRYCYTDAKEKGQELWTQPLGSGSWFDGLDQQEAILLDDFMGAGSHLPLNQLLRLLDGYSLTVPVKGDFVAYHPDTIYVTTNYHPSKWYDFTDRGPSYKAIVRRFTEVREYLSNSVNLYTPGNEEWNLFWII